MTTMISERAVARSVTARVAEMPAHEARFWSIVGAEHTRAVHLLHVAVEWIGDGRGDDVDPYALALAWLRH